MVLANRQRIVAGVDGSDASASAARWAAAMAARLGSPLHLASAIREPAAYVGEPLLAIPAEVWEEEKRTVEGLLSGLAASIGKAHPSLTVTTSVDPAAMPGPMLIELSHTARMLVVGNSGAGLVSTILLGSTAKAVADKAACPVVIWREGTQGADAPITVGVDGGATGEIALERAFEVASHFSAPLIAVHTWNASAAHGIVAFPEFTDWAGVEREEAAVLAESLAGWTDKYPDVAVERVVHQGNATKTLVDRSARSQLVVVGSRGRGVLARTFLGSTSSNLAHHGQCPVMICRDGQ
ncbi:MULTISPECIES: universal stress protein [Nocardiaceae]|jgi:nucleotide-binding universal stress UspA family protein|uniref:universal stress protein n=1 Tax=Nocardiaceae TaxID=85025 RepID=UPI001E56A34A|nr:MULTISPECIES: universal stress protein [Rhodococcus]MCC8929940.1 universal stress protein [Rhodococcus sp. I2R]MCZ4278293.1 universal stress protein [Rhodococcus yunnanensis]